MELSVDVAFAAHQCCELPRLDLHSASSSYRRGFQPVSHFFPSYTHKQGEKSMVAPLMVFAVQTLLLQS